MVSLGSLYCNGQGVPQSYKRGFELFQPSRALGSTHPFLQLNLGICYERGEGVAKDYLEARRFYTLASAQGYAPATNHLSQLDESIRIECPLLGKRVVIMGTSRENPNARTPVFVWRSRSTKICTDTWWNWLTTQRKEEREGEAQQRRARIMASPSVHKVTSG